MKVEHCHAHKLVQVKIATDVRHIRNFYGYPPLHLK